MSSLCRRQIGYSVKHNRAQCAIRFLYIGLSDLPLSRNRPETMQVPYAKKWQEEIDKLRQIALDCDLTEEVK
jgi:hypothetical protein